MLAQVDLSQVNPWSFTPHPEVWLLIGFLLVAYLYTMRVIGPRAVPAGTPVVTRRQIASFAAAIAVLWISSDWPIHDISEDYLYSVHMVQHMSLSFWLPPLALLATPEWLMRLLIGDGKVYRGAKFLTMPVVAALLFNGATLLTHLPSLVNASVSEGYWNGALHYVLHVLVVSSALLMWMPVLGPIKEFQLGLLGKAIYLFAQSIVPTIPAAFLTFSESAVYEAYSRPIRLWGLSLAEDQQLAGAIMKTMAGMYLWAIIIVYFVRYAKQFHTSHNYRRRREIADGVLGDDPTSILTTADVEQVFARTSPVPEDR